MEKYIDKLDWNIISYTHKIVNPVFEKYVKKENNWLYLEEKNKIEKIEKYYTIIEKEGEKYVECYKLVQNNYEAIYKNLFFVYDKLNYKYETICDYNDKSNNHYNHGFECWTKTNIIESVDWSIKNYKLIKCLVPLHSICMLENGQIRSSELFVIEFL